MTLEFTSLLFIWLLPLVAGNSLAKPSEMPEKMHKQMTTQKVSNLNELEEGIPSLNLTPLTRADVNPTEAASGAPTAAAETLSMNTQQVATTTIYSTLSGTNTATTDQTTVTSTAAMAGTTQAYNHTKPTRTTQRLSDSTRSLDPTMTTSGFTRDTTPDASTYPSHSTEITSTATAFTPTIHQSDSTSPNTSSGAVTSTTSPKTSVATPFSGTTNHKAEPKQGPNHSKAVAGIIGGALLLMMVGFVGIYIKKRKMQKQQITTTEWAGPSPFLEGGANNGQTTMRSSNRVSLNSFLPQRLSKRLSLLQETDEELVDMTPGTTFSYKEHENLTGQKVDADEVQESNGTSAVVPETKSTGDTEEARENTVSQTSLQTDNFLSTNNNSEAANLNQNQPAKPSILSGNENASTEMNSDFK